MQAIQFFSEGYRDGTMLKHKLMQKDPTTMAELMEIADKYATADSAMQKSIRLDAAGRVMNGEPVKASPPDVAGSSCRQPDDNKYKRKDAQPGHRAAGKIVVVVEGGRSSAKF